MYEYRVGESKRIRAKVTPTSDDLGVTITSASLRLFGTRDTLIYEEDAEVSGPVLSFLISNIKVKGAYKVQWVYVIAGETRLSDKFPLTVK